MIENGTYYSRAAREVILPNVRESFPEYPNAERFLRSLRWASLAGLCIFLTGVSVGAVTSGVPRAMWLGAAVPFGLFLFVVFWLARRRTIRRVLFSTDCLLSRTRGNERLARFVIDDLGVNVLTGKIDAKPGTFCRSGNLPEVRSMLRRSTT